MVASHVSGQSHAARAIRLIVPYARNLMGFFDYVADAALREQIFVVKPARLHIRSGRYAG